MPMQVVLEILAGPFTGRRIELRPGKTSTVGRTDRAQYAIPHDALLSLIHFSLDWEGDACRIRDLQSSHGTFVNGYPITEAFLRDGDEVTAGATRFAVRYESAERRVAPAAQAPTLPLADTPEESLLVGLRSAYQPLYAILDAARDPQVLELLGAADEEHQSLYEGAKGEVLRQYAPYLVRLPQESSLLETLVWEGWGESWGVYLMCHLGFKEVRRHLRHFLLVKAPNGEELYFRFYDPRVLRVFLPTCPPLQAAEFFGPVTYYLAEDESGDLLLEFVNTPEGAKRRALPLRTEPGGAGAGSPAPKAGPAASRLG
jgi:hypothetical protein